MSGGWDEETGDTQGSRTPIVLGVIAGILLIAVIVTLAIALTRDNGAAPTPTQTETTAETTTPTSSPSETPDATGEPVALQFSGTGFALVDAADEEVFTYGWADDAADAVAALTDAFGAEPTQRVEAGDGTHYPDYTVYQWDGFMLFDMIETAGGTPRAEYAQPSYTLFSRNEVGGIEMVAEQGLEIGMSVSGVRALGPDQEIPRGNVGATRFVFDQERSSAEGAPQYSMFADTDGTAVTSILYFRYSAL
ncbi:MAG: hypothetical protein ABS62_01615 [Microbacterium sp. SCN 70-200]|uniref:hypothetical protein n=1 Tax=unclassified Microbacterium TaxID=2609290 RepID=UPI00086C3403|nr:MULTISPECIES: hypothetical protein [unclassified Microbacterium]MBN9215187.1 hypothetical protein [Microbacterium sp.]ODT42604.1 MAG: hypothetical protein ABS62_01615 [Microbacterium sp. SCN 70-200]OJV80053.1 MAG: hypothetical protein BGO46_07415 [Microbacterium sp. 70-16]